MALPSGYWYARDPSGQWYRCSLSVAGLGIDTVPVSAADVTSDGVVSVTGAAGLPPSEIIAMAQAATENRGKNLNLKRLLVQAAQDVSKERRWHWRKKTVYFLTEPSTSTYDLSQQAGMAGLTCERVHKDGAKLILSATDIRDITPMFETELQEVAREDTTEGEPTQYFMDGQDQMRLVPTPNAIRAVRVPLWVLPDWSEMISTVTLVPPHLHDCVELNLEMKIFRYALGASADKYKAAKLEYREALDRAGVNVNFAEGRVSEWKTDEEAVRST